MKEILVIFLFSFFFSFYTVGDTVETKKVTADSLLRKIEKSRRKIDSALKRADEYFDSITGKSDIDTASLLALQQNLAEKEKEDKQNQWLTQGGVIIVIIVATVAWRRKRKKKQSQTIEPLQ